MSRRIIGQCFTSDFRYIEHLALSVSYGEELDLEHLTKRQQVALKVLYHFQLCNVSFDVLLKLREVLMWEMPDKGLAFEYVLLDRWDSKTRNIIRTMHPREVEMT
jgi:hypothetical protein